MNTYGRIPVSFEKGEGVWLWDNHGNHYLDALAGIAVNGLGHAHPQVTEAVCSQAATLIHTSNLYEVPLQEALARRLCEIANMDAVFFGNSGAEANEAAIKIARLYGNLNEIQNPAIIVCSGSFHGRTLATLSATGNTKIQVGFEPLVEGFIRAPYNDMKALHALAAEHKNIVAVLVEPVQGEGGIQVPDLDYLDEIRSLCDQFNWLMMLDEIQTGMGRTGKWFAYQHNQCRPDVMTLAKSLGNGVPIGACLAQGKAAEVLQPGKHGSTFGGNPLASRAALAVIDAIEKQNCISNAATLGEHMLQSFREQLQEVAGVVSIRGKGLMIGIELDRPCGQLVRDALAQHLLINVTAERVIRLLPPLILTEAQADEIVNTVTNLVIKFLQ